MSEQLHPGLHPDPDSLNAFAEGVLPEHERLQCLAHLAECSRCREVAFLAQEPSAAPPASEPTPAWRRWLAPAPVLAAAAAVCIAVLAVWMYVHRTSGAPNRDTVAGVITAPPAQAPPAPVDIATKTQIPNAIRTRPESAPKRIRPFARGPESASTHDTTSLSLPTPPPIATTPAIPIEQIPFPPTPPLTLASPSRSSSVGLSGISGTVIDATGATVPGATINVRQIDGTITANGRTDVAGLFSVAGLPAGRYEVRINAPGFRQYSQQIDLRPQETASVKSQLDVGSVSETVEVTAGASTIQTSSASVSGVSRKKAPSGPRPLPSKLPGADTVATGKIMLVVDSAGTVFVSRNSGRGWKTVKPVWPGKVSLIDLTDAPQSSISKFQLTTDSGSIWLSRDGQRWFPAPLQH